MSSSRAVLPEGSKTNTNVRHFYVAVDSADRKVATVLELADSISAPCGALGLHGARAGCIALALCCGSRDALDQAVGAVRARPPAHAAAAHTTSMATAAITAALTTTTTVHCLHSDLSHSAAVDTLASFRSSSGLKQGGVSVLALTDVCVGSSAVEERLPGVPLLVNLDLPPAAKQYMARATNMLGVSYASCKGGRGSSAARASGGGGRVEEKVIISVVTPADVAALRAIEDQLGLTIEEMPMDIAEYF